MSVVGFICSFLVDAFWESTLLVACTWAILSIFRTTNATTRYAVWLATLAASLSLPVITTVLTQPHPTPVRTAGTSAAAARAAKAGVGSTAALASLPPATVAASAPRTLAFERPRFGIPGFAGLLVASAWFGIAGIMLVRLASSLMHLEGLKRDALPLAPALRSLLVRWNRACKGTRDVRLCVSDRVAVPTAVGLFDAMILLPDDLVANLSAGDLDRILLHELAHLRRRDDWSNAFAQVAFALLFFSPAVAIAVSRLDLEREVACDDSVLAHDGGDALVYANTLARMTETIAWPHHPLAAPGIFISRRGMSVRIERILEDGRDVRATLANAPAGIALAAIATISLTGAFAPSIALDAAGNTTMTQTYDDATPADISYTGTWAFQRMDRYKRGALLFDLRYPAGFSNWQVPLDLKVLGVLPERLAAPKAPIEFVVRREAGTFTCTGEAGGGDGSGTFRFAPSTAYASDAAKLGLRLSLRDQVVAGMSDVPLSYVRGLAEAGLMPMSLQSLVGFRMMGGSLDRIRALHADFPTADAQAMTSFVTMQDRMPDVHALHEEFPSATVDDITVLGMAGVTPAYVAALRKAGVRGLSANNVSALRAAGVDQAFADKLAATPHAPNLTVDDVVTMKRLQDKLPNAPPASPTPQSSLPPR